jgi:hypothetical protein
VIGKLNAAVHLGDAAEQRERDDEAEQRRQGRVAPGTGPCPAFIAMSTTAAKTKMRRGDRTNISSKL